MGETAPEEEEGSPVSSESVCKPDISPSSSSSSSSSYEIGTDDDDRKRSFGARTSFLTVPVVSSPGFAAGGGSGLTATSTPVVTSPIVAVPVVSVPYFFSAPGLDGSTSFKEQLSMTHQAILATVTAQAQIQLQPGCAVSSEASSRPTSFPPGPTPLKQIRPIKSEEISISSKAQLSSVLDKKPHSTHLIVKTTSSDGYNWRKYGQKQVKSSENFRSYFRCTHANCFAKKNVEHCQDGRVIEVIYRGQHNHEPPPKAKCFKEKISASNNPEGVKTSLHVPRLELKSLDLCSPNTEKDPYTDTPERLHSSSDSEGDPAVNIGDDTGNEPDPKRRLCEASGSYLAPSFKTVKEPKVVVHAASNSGTINDGYRWRKYGQKMVKGNPNPRSYYRCTNMGCPVRKHVEKASDDAKLVIITYEGQHNHDLPPGKSGSETLTCTPAAKLTLDDKEAVVTSDEHMLVSSPLLLLDRKVSTDCKLKKDEEEFSAEGAQDPGGKLVLESAETLLSIRCNSAPGDGGKASNSDVIQCPLFDRSHSVVSVRNS